MFKIYNNITAQVFLLTVIGTMSAAAMITGVKFLSKDLHSFEIAFFRCFCRLAGTMPITQVSLRSKPSVGLGRIQHNHLKVRCL